MLFKSLGSFSLIFGVLSGTACQGVNGIGNKSAIESGYACFEKDEQDSKEDTEKSEAASSKNKVKLEERIKNNSRGVLGGFLPANGKMILKDHDSSDVEALSLDAIDLVKGLRVSKNKRRVTFITDPLLMIARIIPVLRNWGPLKRYYNFWNYKDNDFLEVIKRILEVIFLVDFLVIFSFILFFGLRYGVESNRNIELLSVASLCAASPLMSRVLGTVLSETWSEYALNFIFGIGTTQFLTSALNAIMRRSEERRRREIIRLALIHIADQ